MSVTVTWADTEKTILYFEYKGQWSSNDVFRVVQDSQKMMEEAKHPVASIIDLTQGRQLPMKSADYLSDVVETRSRNPYDSGITVFVNALPLTRAMLDLMELKNPQATRFATFAYVNSYNEAVATAKRMLAEMYDSN